jgi:hypothetical protein
VDFRPGGLVSEVFLPLILFSYMCVFFLSGNLSSLAHIVEIIYFLGLLVNLSVKVCKCLALCLVLFSFVSFFGGTGV